jgi:signal transduction histidine kinase
VLNVAFYSLITGATVLVAWRLSMRERQVATLERRQEAVAREAVMAERRRLAHELHDIVSHAVTVMVLQSAGARIELSLDGAEPPPAAVLADVRDALGHIESKGKEAMAELRRLLSVMREAGQVPHEPDTSRGLGDLGSLCDSFAGAGVEVAVSVSGTPEHLDPSIDLTAYRVVREALTNTAKHGGAGSAATVDLRWADDLVIDIRDTPGAPRDETVPLSTGTGLLGMRERVRALGGRLEVGDRPDRPGYQVRAVLPLSGSGRS